MKFYFDESGKFAVNIPGPHSLVGIMYPEVSQNKLYIFYKNFINSLSPTEFVKGEPKGTELTQKSRERLFSFLKNNSWLKICVSLTDSEFNSEVQIQQYRIEQEKIYKAQLTDPLFQRKLCEIKTLIDYVQLKNGKKGLGLSDVEFIKGLLLMHNLYSLFINAFYSFTDRIYDDNWKIFDLNFDRQEKLSITKMERWINIEFNNLITVNNARRPIELHPDWYLRNHPILKLFRDGNENSFLLNKMFIKGFNFLSSEYSYQIQIVDWISNTLFKVFKKDLSIDFLNMLSSNLIRNNNSRIHLVVFTNSDKDAIYNKYKDFL